VTVGELKAWLADKPDDMPVTQYVDGEETEPLPQLASTMFADKVSTHVWDATPWNKYMRLRRKPERVIF
jgi:hypothetical protein